MLRRLCIVFAMLYVPVNQAAQLPENYGVYYQAAGKYQPMLHFRRGVKLADHPIFNNPKQQIELLVYSKNFDDKKLSVLYEAINFASRNITPLLATQPLRYKISPMKRKDMYKIDVEISPQLRGGLLVYQYHTANMNIDYYSIALGDPENLFEVQIKNPFLTARQHQAVVNAAISAYPANSYFQSEQKRLQQNISAKQEQISYEKAMRASNATRLADLKNAVILLKTHLHFYPNGKHNDEVKAKLAELEPRYNQRKQVADARKLSDEEIIKQAQTIVDKFSIAFKKGKCEEALKYVDPKSKGIYSNVKHCKVYHTTKTLKITSIRAKDKTPEDDDVVTFFGNIPTNLRIVFYADAPKIDSINW